MLSLFVCRVVSSKEPRIRMLGLGAHKSTQTTPPHSRIDNEKDCVLKRGSYGKITIGRKKGNYFEVCTNKKKLFLLI